MFVLYTGIPWEFLPQQLGFGSGMTAWRRLRARPGSKRHLITEAHGIPLAVSLTGGNRNDVTQLMPLIEAIPPVRGRRGRSASAARYLSADRTIHEAFLSLACAIICWRRLQSLALC